MGQCPVLSAPLGCNFEVWIFKNARCNQDARFHRATASIARGEPVSMIRPWKDLKGGAGLLGFGLGG